MRENIKNLDWFQESHYDTYDTLRHYVQENNEYPNNTIFMGNSPKKGFLSFDLLYNKLKDEGAKILYRSDSYSTGIRKIYFNYEGTFYVLESIYNRRLDDYQDYPEILDSKKDSTGMINIIGSLTILYHEEIMAERHVKIIEASFIKPKEFHTIGMIARDNNGYFLNEMRLEVKELSHELDLHYGDGFTKFHETLTKKLILESKGLTLLHGLHGTGKSFYIKKLIYDLTEKTKKKIVLLPSNMISYILDPEFSSFLLELSESFDFDDFPEYDDLDLAEKTNNGIILILEDAEPVLQKRDAHGQGQSTSNILNLTDGILNDIFGIQIIATYNTKDANIDPALKREKRLMAKREFKELSLVDSKKLAKYLKIDPKVVKKEMSVAEIYAILDKDENDILIDKKDKKKTGLVK